MSRKLTDEEKPDFIFSSTSTSLLVKAVNGKINLEQLAMLSLADRGLNAQGLWIGFKKSRELYLSNCKLNKKWRP